MQCDGRTGRSPGSPALFLSTGRAATLTFTLGSATPSFTDGQTGIGTGTFNTKVAGNAAPFNGFIGSDISGPNFSASWTYGYGALTGTITAATLTIGMWDHDFATTGDQVAAFTLSGVDLTAALNTGFNSHGGATGEYDIYTIALPAGTFAALAGGAPALSLSLQGPGLCVLGETTFDGAGLDFSTLTITTQDEAQVPETSTWAAIAAGIAIIGLARIQRRRTVSNPETRNSR